MVLAWTMSGAVRRVGKRCGVMAGVAAAVLAGSNAQAEGCHGISYGTLPVELIGGDATTMVKINGRDTRFILDTGAFYNTMSRAMATALGLTLQMAPIGFHVSGIGGETSVSLTTVKNFGILGADLHNIEFVVGGSDAGTGLIGANLLDVADLDADLAEGKISLIKPMGCGKASMAYWAKDGNYNVASLLESRGPLDRASHVTVMVNGKPVRAELDTGAHTLITRRAAQRVGIDLTAATVTPGGTTGGIGSKRYDSWIAKVALYQVGTESIQNSRMRVIDGDIDASSDPTEMLLGIDFFLSHHIFVANSQRKVYFTYNGGRVSVLDKVSEMSPASKPGTPAPEEPTTAQAIGLRGQAHLSRGEMAEGMADLDKAIAMAPDAADSAGFYYERAKARLMMRAAAPQAVSQAEPEAAAEQGSEANRARLDAALADLDASLRLAPGRPEVLLDRARLLLGRRERARGLADLDAALRVVQPGSAQALLLARMLTGVDRAAEALPLLDTWIRLHGEDGGLGSALNARCWARGLTGTALEGAAEDCRKAIKRDGDKPAYLDSAGLVQLRLGHNDQALDLYAQVLAKEPKRGWARYGHAVAALRLGQEAGKAELAAVKLSNPAVVAQGARIGVTPP